MKYVALLRAINVGGKNIIRMAALRSCLEDHGFECVATFIQSGNVIFESAEKNAAALTQRMEAALSRTFRYDSRIVLRSQRQLEAVLAGVPPEWKRRKDLRRYIAFVREPVTAKQALAEVDAEPGIDVVTAGKGVLYMSTLLTGLNRSGLRKMVAKKVYRDVTVRNYTTCEKILAMMTAAP